jgi:hypothetical protein
MDDLIRQLGVSLKLPDQRGQLDEVGPGAGDEIKETRISWHRFPPRRIIPVLPQGRHEQPMLGREKLTERGGILTLPGGIVYICWR